MIMKFFETYNEYHRWREGKRRIGFFVENNRMYPNYAERKAMCQKNADYVVYSFTPNYERLVGIPDELAAKLFKASRDTADDVMENRDFNGVDVVLIPREDQVLEDMEKFKKWVASGIKYCGLPYDKEDHQYIRALYGTAYYLCHRPHYIALCPYPYLYNVYAKRALDYCGIDSEYIKGITEGGILDGTSKIFSV